MLISTGIETVEECVERVGWMLDGGLVSHAEAALDINAASLAAEASRDAGLASVLTSLRSRIAEGKAHELLHGEGSLITTDDPRVASLVGFLAVADRLDFTAWLAKPATSPMQP